MEEAINDTYSLNCKGDNLLVGSLFLFKGDHGEGVLDLAEYAKETGFEFIEIFTNGTLLTPAKVARIKSLGINIAVSLYSRDPDVHDKITHTPGSHKKTMAALQMLKATGFPLG